MSSRDAFLLSPYRPPTSYPVGLDPDEAAAWLSGYFALWHPAVVATLSRPPQPASAYDHDQPAEGAIYTVPAGPHLHQPDDWPQRATAAHAVAVTATPDRADTLERLLDGLRATGEPLPFDASPDTVRAFAGLGFGYLMVETLFDAAGHDRLLDAEGFWADVSAAAWGVTSRDESFRCLRAAADKLRSAREALNGGTAPALLDLMIVAADKPDAEWPDSVRRGLPLTVLLAAEALEKFRANHPARFAQLKSRLAPGLPLTLDIVCGAYRERDDALLPPESQWWNFRKGRAVVKALLGETPAVYGRHKTALHAHLPGWLSHAGFRSAVMVNFDGALLPARSAAVVNWSGPDGKAVDAFAKEPLPGHDPLTFFNLGYHLHQAITADTAPVLAVSHAGKPAAVGYDELLALADLGDVLGAFAGMGRFLADHHYGEYLGSATPDDFFADALDDRVTRQHRPDPVSGFAAFYRLRRRLDAAFALAALHRTLAPPGEVEEDNVRDLERLEDAIEARGPVGFAGGLGRSGADQPTARIDGLGANLAVLEGELARALADRVQARSASGRPGLVVLNPCGFARRVGLRLDPFPVPIPVEGPVKAAQFDADKTRLVVEVPACGFAWVPRPTGPAGMPPPPRTKLRMAEGTTVRNEFLEAELDPATGSLRAVRDVRTRVARLGMQLVFNPGSRMKARNVRVTLAGPAVGEVVADGDIVDDHDNVLAMFRHRVRAWAGRPALEISVEFDPRRGPTGHCWHAYYAARFAWRDERAALFRGAAGANAPTHSTRPGSPDYVEVRFGAERAFVFTGGLPFAQRSGGRMLDVVLLPEREQGRRFDLLVAFDRDYPMATATGWCAPAPVVPTDRGPPPGGPSGWLADVDLPSLLMTSLRPEASKEGRAVTARFIETAGFGGTADLRFARPPAGAALVDGEGAELHRLTPAAGAVPLEFSANEAFRVRAEWPGGAILSQ
jgi:hypothetical protein